MTDRLRLGMVGTGINVGMIAICEAAVESLRTNLPVKGGPYYRQAGLE